ncbi:MAG TPA: hypothetical protein PK760_00730 [Flavobacteriales bacterium]|nr:hypothetical protein [Flavobacteriales bacterium]
MNLRYFVTACVILAAALARTQVTIPDPNFAAALEIAVPDAMNGDQLDPAHPSVAALDTLVAESMNIINVNGLEYFTGLTYLDLSDNFNIVLPSSFPALLNFLDLSYAGLTSLPALPSGLVQLNVGTNYGLNSLPPLPASITHLSIGSTGISSLAGLPDGLLTLYVGNSAVTVIQDLPATLELLDLWHSEGISIVNLPDGLMHLGISQCALTVWPTVIADLNALNSLVTSGNDWSSATIILPPNLEVWGSDNSNISVLPDLPASLTYLDVYNNDIAVLPPLPPNLTFLSIAGSPISAPLDPVPSSLEYLDIGLTNIPELGVLPETLYYLDCTYCWMLTCLPNIPSGLAEVGMGGSSIQCLPSPLPPGVLALEANPVWPPVCSNFDVYCAPAPYIAGRTYYDANGNGVQDDGGTAMPFAQMRVDPGNIQFGTTDAGLFRAHVQPGSYTVSVVPGPYQTVTTAPQAAVYQ